MTFCQQLKTGGDFRKRRMVEIGFSLCKKVVSFLKFHLIINMGKFQVINKSLVPGCKKEYSANIVKQASMKIDAEKCADIKYLQVYSFSVDFLHENLALDHESHRYQNEKNLTINIKMLETI